ncbi:helix-turn-helix domain-containing protein [Paenibacillus sp. y28]|uniref:helix-turn-helix domain-containing protein n=1 Tax=Paenibacillus sp. y28 TaxID=3129110 RepID=UPI00301AF96C
MPKYWLRLLSYSLMLGAIPVIIIGIMTIYNAWVYVYTAPNRELAQQTQSMVWVTAASCALLAAFALVGAYYGSRKMYLPVQRLFEMTKKLSPDTSMGSGVTRGEDELRYIEDRLQLLTSTGRQLQQQMRVQVTQLKEYAMFRLINGQMPKQEFDYRAREYDFPSDWRYLGVLTLQIDTLHGTRYREHDKDLLLFAINNIVSDLLPLTRFSPIVMEQSQVTVLASDTLDGHELLSRWWRMAERIQSKVKKYLQLSVSIGISKPYECISGTAKAHEESLGALRSRVGLGQDIIVQYGDTSSQTEMEAMLYEQLMQMEERLLHALRTGEPDKAAMLFSEYLSVIVGREAYFSEYSELMIAFISKIYQMIHEQGVPLKKVIGPQASVAQFMKLNTIPDITDWFQRQLFVPVTVFLAEQAEAQYENIADQMVRLIHQHYERDFTLEECAQTMSFHPVYLSRVFKKETGVSFSNYLMECRMNKAKQLLETTDMKVSEISERLQYKNISAFIRSFRKTFGMTPGNYREKSDKQISGG